METKIEQIAKELIKTENTLKVKRQAINLIAGSLGNPSIFVGVLPYYDWSKDKRVTYIITSRFISCEMLVYEKLLKDIEHVKTQDPEVAKQAVKNLIMKLAMRE